MKIDSKQVLGGIIILAIAASLLFGDADAEPREQEVVPSPAVVDTDGKQLVLRSVSGFLFKMPGNPVPWRCWTEGGGVVSCDAGKLSYTCAWVERPVYFNDCKVNDEETPAAFTFELNGA